MKLILLRHGESVWNLENRFTGWTNVDLTDNGKIEAKNAGKLISNGNIRIDYAYISFLKRAIKSYKICMREQINHKICIKKDWRLNERHYGNLQGLNKSETAKKYGSKQVKIWRRSYNIPPPELSEDDVRHPKFDKLYKNIDRSMLPKSESLKDTLERVKPLWQEEILPKLQSNKNILIVAHGNSLRAIVKILKNISNEDIVNVNIPTGMPYVFNFNSDIELISDNYLGNEDEVVEKTKIVEKQASG
tara:strand:+ start:3356 stop:4096 length:741 start_codon:yes stop_codon:yes gene_type:complete